MQRWLLVALVVGSGVLLGTRLHAKPPGSGIVDIEHQGARLWAVAADGTVYLSIQDPADGWAGGPFHQVGHLPGTPVAIAVDGGAGDVYVALSNGDLYWAITSGPGPFNFTLRRNIQTP